ncbi:glycosyltransferase family 4 protein [Cloacibacillus porcorum]|uniref:Glycosyl transferase family 1 n=1 Tax=Cloacibacillus porcorum TaxID=1197717 RepID=A0A1B2I7A0_9BACT|nr:glycosyltransferase family 4 protein [Cloacibacillus porcorum]ANZ45852.1 hypothetical protein BED41_12615 [Cloacibacillus porcorum]
MKILHYVDENKLAWGETWIQLIHELAVQGVDNFVVCRPGGSLPQRLTEEGIPFAVSTPFIQSLPITNLGFGKILKREKPDIIHTRLSAAARIGGWWGKCYGIPVVETIDKYPKIKYYKNASMIFPCSNAVLQHMEKKGFPPEKMVVVYNPVDILRYRRDDIVRENVRNKYGVPKDTKIILGAGRFIDWKGFEYLIDAYFEVTNNYKTPYDTRLWLVGDGPEMKKYRDLSEKYQLTDRIEFHGFARDIRPWLWAADIFVQPSQLPEGFSLMLLEAMAAGLPSIATNIGGTLDIIKDGYNGWFMGVGIDSGLAEKLFSVIGDDQLLSCVALKALESANEFNVRRIAHETITLYRKILER